MQFNSGTFLIFFIFFLIVFSFIHQKRIFKTVFVIAFSLFFYYKVTGWHLVFILIPLLLDFFIAKQIARLEINSLKRRLWFWSSLVINIGMLGYFKYTNFFSEIISNLSGNAGSALEIIVPVGISFYIFRTISYIIDVYRDDIKPETDFLNFAFYFTFFPLLISGPITRASTFLPQLRKPVLIDQEKLSKALYFIIIGLIKKAVIADYLAQYNDLVFKAPATYSGFENLMAVYGYIAQIYFDFSGYTDIAIGIALIIGIDIGINFNKPYHALNLSDFWRRWHISLSNWLRDYLFSPLSLKFRNIQKWGVIIALIITFTICGFWHGGALTYIVWGLLNGIIMGVEVLLSKYRKKVRKKTNTILYNVLNWFITFHVIALLWIIFRCATLNDAWLMLSQVFGNMDWAYVGLFFSVRGMFVFVLFASIALYAIPVKWFTIISNYFVKIPFWAKMILFIIVVQLIVQFQSETVQPFIYAGF
jgi:alginate O-acetyltransferase complex protein AlgI